MANDNGMAEHTVEDEKHEHSDVADVRKQQPAQEFCRNCSAVVKKAYTRCPKCGTPTRRTA